MADDRFPSSFFMRLSCFSFVNRILEKTVPIHFVARPLACTYFALHEATSSEAVYP
jgi:hypothetical protein